MPVIVGGPVLGPVVWTGRVVSVHQSDLHNRVTNYQRVSVAATNSTAAPGGVAPGDLSDTAAGGYYLLEDSSGDYQLEDGSGRYVLEGTAFVYRNLSLQKSQNQDGTVTTYGSLETFEGGYAAGMSFNLTSANFGITAQAYTITNVTMTFLHTTPLYTLEFGDAYQTLQTAGGGVLTQVGSQATIQQGSAVPAGTLGYAEVTTDQGSITTAVDLTGLSATFTAVSGRRYSFKAHSAFQSTVANDYVSVTIWDGVTVYKTAYWDLGIIGAQVANTVEAVITGLSASVHTIKVTAARAVGSGTLTMKASTGLSCHLVIQDIGT